MLMEMVVAVALLGVLFAAFAVLAGTAIRAGGEAESTSVLQTEVRAAVDVLGHDLRQSYSGSDTVSPIAPLSGTTLASSGFRFDSPDRAQPFHLRRISYRFSGNRLERQMAISTDTDGYPWSFGAAGPWVTQLQNVTSGSFAYYGDDQNGDDQPDPVTDPLLVRFVAVKVTVATKTSPARQATYSTDIELRTPVTG